MKSAWCEDSEPSGAPSEVGLLRWRTLTLLMMAVTGLTGCIGASAAEDPFDPGAAIYVGLDPAVVAEVLESPVARQKLVEEPPETRASLGQGMVRNFLVCRDALRVYQTWLATGQQPDLAPLPTVENPVEPSNAHWIEDFSRLDQLLDSGDPDRLRTWLTGKGSCGQWISAVPGDPGGPTIADVIEAG